MNGRALLDTDMRTLGQWLVQGGRWWIDELQAMVPARWRERAGRALPRFVVENGALVPEAGPAGPVPRPGLCAVVVVPRALCLVRLVERPLVRPRDLPGMLALEGEALLPLPPQAVVVAGRALKTVAPGRMMVEAAGLPLEDARRVSAAITAARLDARAVTLETADAAAPIDFLPAMRAAGLLEPQRSATPLAWGLVATLVAANIAALVGHDIAETRRLERLIEEQQPAMNTARTIRRRIDADRTLITGTTALRQRHDPLRALTEVSNALPAGVWLQRLSWDGETVRLTGYRPVAVDVSSALRRSGSLTEVRVLNDETQATTPAGVPFDISGWMVRP